MGQPHVLVVDDTDRQDGPERLLRIECPGVTDACRRWLECHHDHCPPFRSGDAADQAALIDGGFDAHEVRHAYRDGGGFVPLHWCAVQHHRGLADAALELAVPGPGRYPVEHRFADRGQVLELHLVEEVSCG